jgi:hypothetical protein
MAASQTFHLKLSAYQKADKIRCLLYKQ